MALSDFSWLRIVDRKRMEVASWEPWLRNVAKTRRAFSEFITDYDPMSNETASCGVLSSAASAAGLLSMTEYLCLKKDPQHYSKRVNGRADLWVCDTGRRTSWAFEAKQVRCVAGTRLSTLENAMADACDEASRMPDLEADRRFGLVIATMPPDAEPEAMFKLVYRLDAFAEEADFACRVEGGRHPTYLFFRFEHRKRK
jgi:hypothetical protein